MPILPLVTLTDGEHAALNEALRTTKRLRDWRRLQAVHLLASGREAPEVAAILGCSASSVYYWANDWRTSGLAGLFETPHSGRPHRLDNAAEAELQRLLGEDPQVHGYASTEWTVPLLTTELEKAGHPVSERTLRRVLHRLGWRWKRPKYLLGRPDPAYEAKKGRWSSK
jgi:transposase